MDILKRSNINFSGLLYGKIGVHKTKPILCCPHGDAKFIKFINKIAENGQEQNALTTINVSFSDKGLNKIIIETDNLPKLNLLEKILYNANKLQIKALKMRKEGKISSFVYQLNELEYKNLKENYLFISNKQLNKFAEIIKKYSPQEVQIFLASFFK